ncbi:MAG: hypothetical protein ACRCXC_00050 [Legionella sp.]
MENVRKATTMEEIHASLINQSILGASDEEIEEVKRKLRELLKTTTEGNRFKSVPQHYRQMYNDIMSTTIRRARNSHASSLSRAKKATMEQMTVSDLMFLEEQNSDLRKENDSLKAENDALQKEIAALKDENRRPEDALSSQGTYAYGAIHTLLGSTASRSKSQEKITVSQLNSQDTLNI